MALMFSLLLFSVTFFLHSFAILVLHNPCYSILQILYSSRNNKTICISLFLYVSVWNFLFGEFLLYRYHVILCKRGFIQRVTWRTKTRTISSTISSRRTDQTTMAAIIMMAQDLENSMGTKWIVFQVLVPVVREDRPWAQEVLWEVPDLGKNLPSAAHPSWQFSRLSSAIEINGI